MELRHLSWDLLRRLHAMFDLPWIVAGNFNEILFLDKKNRKSKECLEN